HSIYDSFSWVDTYGDPGFRYFQAAARLWGLMTLRLATSDILPFDPTIQATALEEYVAALSPAAGENEVAERTETVGLSGTDLAPLREAVATFRAAADAVGSWVDASANVKTIPVSAAAAARAVLLHLNERLAMTERRFLSEEGLPGRKWFRHVLQAPGLYLG
ncbi:unnamed protein product, partial [Laminaria digitata]